MTRNYRKWPYGRMAQGQRLSVYLIFGSLWLTGCLWLCLDQFFARPGQFGIMPHPWEPAILLLHGVIAILSMSLLGWITAKHVMRWWPAGLRRLSGATLSAFVVLLAVSGFGLFFLSEDRSQHVAAVSHDVLGLGLTVFAIQHWFFAKRGDVRAVVLLIGCVLGFGNAPAAQAQSAAASAPFGVTSRIAPAAYLHMPPSADGTMPRLLSQTGVFTDTAHMVPSPGLIPYELVAAFWSDGAAKLRWASIPTGTIQFSPTGEWRFPAGSIFVKTFELPVDAANPKKRRLETRLLVRDRAGGVYGVDYKWRADNSDADLLTTSVTEDIPIKAANGEVHHQTWYYPSRHDCQTCHTTTSGGVLGVKTRQMNKAYAYPSGVTDNQLRTWNHLGLLSPGFTDAQLETFPKLAAMDDATRSLQDRARSYLDANCSQCHRPGGTIANFDARYDTPLDQQNLIDGPVVIDQGIDRPRVISPHDIWRSIAFMRVNTADDIRMPPLARETIDQKGVELLREWITSLPGRAVLEPPVISPKGGTFDKPVDISLTQSEPGTDIRYTLDGSVPGPSDMRYEKPIHVDGPTVLRTRAYKEGFTRSIITQEVFIVGK